MPPPLTYLLTYWLWADRQETLPMFRCRLAQTSPCRSQARRGAHPTHAERTPGCTRGTGCPRGRGPAHGCLPARAGGGRSVGNHGSVCTDKGSTSRTNNKTNSLSLSRTKGWQLAGRVVLATDAGAGHGASKPMSPSRSLTQALEKGYAQHQLALDRNRHLKRIEGGTAWWKNAPACSG